MPTSSSVLAATIPAPNEPVRITELARPSLEPGAALLHVLFSEVCGTDVHLHHGKLAGVPYPLIPGHVSVGVIAELRGPLADVEGTPFWRLDVKLPRREVPWFRTGVGAPTEVTLTRHKVGTGGTRVEMDAYLRVDIGSSGEDDVETAVARRAGIRPCFR